MARYRLTKSAKADIGSIVRTSEERHGCDAGIRYLALLFAAMNRLAADPMGHGTSDRGDLRPGIRSFHIRYSRGESGWPVANPVHVIFYRVVEPGLIEIVRVPHERMEAGRHIDPEAIGEARHGRHGRF